MTKDSRIIQSSIIHPGSRTNRRMSLIEANKRLMDLNARQAQIIKNTNILLTGLSNIMGVHVPTSEAEGANAVDALIARTKELVEKEKSTLPASLP